jgi:hydroxylation protein CepL
MIGFDSRSADQSGGRMMVVSEGSWHSTLKRLIGPFLSRLRAPELETVLRQEIGEAIEHMTAQSVTDVATAVGPRIPAAVVCEVLGVPLSDREQLIELTHHAFGGHDSLFDEMTPTEAHAEILFYFHELIEERRRKPGTDLVSSLLADGQLSVEDILVNCDNVLIGGNETTRHAIAGAFHILHEFPDVLGALREDPLLLDTAVEEVVRWTSPAMHVLRVASRDCTIGGRPIEEGAPVVAWLSAANRDPRHFSDPHTFRPGRHPNRHLGFGNGPHHCLGAALARIELRELLRRLSEDVGCVGLEGPPRWMRSNLVQGYAGLPVTLRWR